MVAKKSQLLYLKNGLPDDWIAHDSGLQGVTAAHDRSYVSEVHKIDHDLQNIDRKRLKHFTQTSQNVLVWRESIMHITFFKGSNSEFCVMMDLSLEFKSLRLVRSGIFCSGCWPLYIRYPRRSRIAGKLSTDGQRTVKDSCNPYDQTQAFKWDWHGNQMFRTD